jgi:hypothetical protein
MIVMINHDFFFGTTKTLSHQEAQSQDKISNVFLSVPSLTAPISKALNINYLSIELCALVLLF